MKTRREEPGGELQESGCPISRGRHAAGQDPAKRDQILTGAHCVFSRMGFDAASMNDITREAGVSKGTVYVYFQNKEELFEALIERERKVIFGGIDTALEGDGPVAEKLYRYGSTITRLIMSDEVIRAQRIIIGVSERKPELGAAFYERGPLRGKHMMIEFLEKEIGKGTLVVDDVEIAGFQFAELCMAGLFRPRIFGHLGKEPDAEMIHRSVSAAVRVFLKAYAVDPEECLKHCPQ